MTPMLDDTKGPSAEALRFIDEISLCPHADEILAWAFAFDAFAAQAIATTPIDAVLFCPACGVQHIDQPQREKGWSNPAHKTHECQGCGHLWRPSSTPTNGVADVALGTSDIKPPIRGAAARAKPAASDAKKGRLEELLEIIDPEALDRFQRALSGCLDNGEPIHLAHHYAYSVAGAARDAAFEKANAILAAERQALTEVRREGEIAMRDRCVLAAQKVLSSGGTREAAVAAIRSLSPEGDAP